MKDALINYTLVRHYPANETVDLKKYAPYTGRLKCRDSLESACVLFTREQTPPLHKSGPVGDRFLKLYSFESWHMCPAPALQEVGVNAYLKKRLTLDQASHFGEHAGTQYLLD